MAGNSYEEVNSIRYLIALTGKSCVHFVSKQVTFCRYGTRNLEFVAHPPRAPLQGLDARRAAWGLLQVCNCTNRSEKLLVGTTPSQLR